MKKVKYYKKTPTFWVNVKNFTKSFTINKKHVKYKQNQLLENINSKISKKQNQTLIKEIEIFEIKEALQNMENDKSPGIDGIPVEFYKELFDILKKDLQNIFNKVLFNLETTPKTWNQAITTLIPKQTENLHSLKYCRPISLLSTDYKILTKILANRLKQIMPQVISQEQNCSVSQRTIFNNLLLITDLIKYKKEKIINFIY